MEHVGQNYIVILFASNLSFDEQYFHNFVDNFFFSVGSIRKKGKIGTNILVVGK